MSDHDQPHSDAAPEQPAAQPQPGTPAIEEQIGALHFVPNPDYPYPFKVERAPHFWMAETTGALGDAVDTYLNGERLAPPQLELIKLYLRQYVERALLSGGVNRKLLLSKIDKLKTTADVEAFADEISEYGAEVF